MPIENPALFDAADQIAATIATLKGRLAAKQGVLAEKRALHAAILESCPSGASYAEFVRASLASMAMKGAGEIYRHIDSLAHPRRYGVVVTTDMQKPLTFKEMRGLVRTGTMEGAATEFDGLSVLPDQYMGAPSRNVLAFLLQEEIQLKLDALLAARPVALRTAPGADSLKSYAQLEQDLAAVEDEIQTIEAECAAIRQDIARLGGKA